MSFLQAPRFSQTGAVITSFQAPSCIVGLLRPTEVIVNTRTDLSPTICVLVFAAAGVLTVQGQPAGPFIRIGTYDSRAIAVAYARSDMNRNWLAQLIADRDKAKAAGDEKRVRELETQGKAQQARLHEQGFSTGSVSNLMDKIRQEIPAVAKSAGVMLVVSKWEVMYRDPAVEYVDVTIPLVRRFSADPEVLRIAEELMKHDPIPLDQLPPDMD